MQTGFSLDAKRVVSLMCFDWSRSQLLLVKGVQRASLSNLPRTGFPSKGPARDLLTVPWPIPLFSLFLKQSTVVKTPDLAVRDMPPIALRSVSLRKRVCLAMVTWFDAL
jgi:hypothetical protein